MSVTRIAKLSAIFLLAGLHTACISSGKKKRLKSAEKKMSLTEKRNPFTSDAVYLYENDAKSDDNIELSTRRSGTGPEQPALWRGFSEDELSLGPFSMQRIKEVTAANSHQIANCYQKATVFQPQNGQNNLVISFTIGNKGKVVKVETLVSPFRADVVSRLDSCLISKMVTWKFPVPDQDHLTIQQPFTFGI